MRLDEFDNKRLPGLVNGWKNQHPGRHASKFI